MIDKAYRMAICSGTMRVIADITDPARIIHCGTKLKLQQKNERKPGRKE
jgi:hypothetical protein